MNISSKLVIMALLSFTSIVGVFSSGIYQNVSGQQTDLYLDFPVLLGNNQTSTSEADVLVQDGQTLILP